MNPFNPRSVADHRDACESEENARDMDAFERECVRDELRDLVERAAKRLLAAWTYAEDNDMDPDQAVEDALQQLDTLRDDARRERMQGNG